MSALYLSMGVNLSFFYVGKEKRIFPGEMAMSAESSGLFTLKELNRIKVLQDVIDRNMTPGRAAVVLGILYHI